MVSRGKLKHNLLRGPLLKIERAKHHINDLNGQISEYLVMKPIEFWIRQGKNPPQRTVYTKAEPPIPDGFALIVGDAINNIRSALDHICFAMVESKMQGKQDRKKIGFPFAKDAEDLHSAISQRKMNLASENVIQEFHALKPYPSGDRYLSAIQDLNNSDKHHTIVTAVTGAEMTWPQLKDFLPSALIPQHAADTVIQTMGDFCVSLDPTNPIEIFDKKANSQPTIHIGFGQGEALENDAFVAALNKITIRAEDAVRRLARAFFE